MARSRTRAVASMFGLVAAFAPSSAMADGTGGAQAPGRASVADVTCVATAATPCPTEELFVAGSTARVEGRALQGSRALIFRGTRGRADDVAAQARHVRAGHFEATVPVRARSGPVAVVAYAGRRIPAAAIRVVSQPTLADSGAFFADGDVKPALTFDVEQAATMLVRVVSVDDDTVVRAFPVLAQPGTNTVTWSGRTDSGPASSGRYRFELGGEARATITAAATSFTYLDHLFPIRGKHDLGQSPTNNFGGGRGHRGQDMFAACGTPLAVARGGRVRFAGFNAAAGNYAVITSPRTGLDYVYMHMRTPASVATGEKVITGQALGEVGDTGRASGCHLHFELWSRPGWYSGGAAFDPLPRLRAWDAWS